MSAEGGGCSGMSYGMTFTDQVHDHDLQLKSGNVTLIVDSVAAGYMDGTEIDYVEQGANASFVFNNAFTTTQSGGSCGGCGSAGGGGAMSNTQAINAIFSNF